MLQRRSWKGDPHRCQWSPQEGTTEEWEGLLEEVVSELDSVVLKVEGHSTESNVHIGGRHQLKGSGLWKPMGWVLCKAQEQKHLNKHPITSL